MTRTGTLIRLLCALLLGSVIGCAIASTTATDTSIRDYQHQLSQHPGDYRLYLKLGSAYMQKAREGGDATYYDEAELAFRRSLELKPEHAPRAVLRGLLFCHRGTARRSRHQILVPRIRNCLQYASPQRSFVGTGKTPQRHRATEKDEGSRGCSFVPTRWWCRC